MQKTKSLTVKSNTLRKLNAGVTQARVGQSRSGCSLTTTEVLQFNLDHAFARDAIHAKWNYEKMIAIIKEQGIETTVIRTKVFDRKTYLLNPHLGSEIFEEDEKNLKDILSQQNNFFDIVIIMTDGLSAFAIEEHCIPFLNQLYLKLNSRNLKIAPLIFSPFGRVALSDAIGSLLQAKIAIILVGERPGLSAANSMGIYLTYNPTIGKQNSDRNCISNIRPPFGLSYADAANQLFDLIEKSLKSKLSGSKLKIR